MGARGIGRDVLGGGVVVEWVGGGGGAGCGCQLMWRHAMWCGL